ncbi:MAG: hypothetical protein COA33_015010 [Fluviicola sp.]|nr:hypothetical protein [Fluviicola sp.]
MKTILKFSLLLIFANSCTEDVTKDTDLPVIIDNVGELTHYEILFDEKDFPSEEHLDLLKELDVCDTIINDTTNCATCTPDYFKILPFRTDKNIKDAFLLQIRALTVMKGQDAKLPMRHLIVFEREKGKLVKVNGFRGKLIATRISETGVDDLVIRFYIPDEAAFFNCLFLWEGSKYRFKSVEAIDGNGGQGAVKASMKEELSKDVYQLLMENTLIF